MSVSSSGRINNHQQSIKGAVNLRLDTHCVLGKISFISAGLALKDLKTEKADKNLSLEMHTIIVTWFDRHIRW